jgi:rSAM/selenodomain-associated transferase 1
MTPALAIFVKTPGLSPVKTRLATRIGSSEAIRFYMLAAAATAAVVRSCELVLTAYWAVAETAPHARTTWQGFNQVGQGEGDLGARLHCVYSELQQRHGTVLLIGADSPQLTPSLLKHALAALDDPNQPFAIGRATDGGFWLFGGRQPIPRSVWDGVRYSQADTVIQLRGALAAFGGIATLPELTDVDDAADLPQLAAALSALHDPLPAQAELSSWVRAMLDRLDGQSQASQRVDLTG